MLDAPAWAYSDHPQFSDRLRDWDLWRLEARRYARFGLPPLLLFIGSFPYFWLATDRCSTSSAFNGILPDSPRL